MLNQQPITSKNLESSRINHNSSDSKVCCEGLEYSKPEVYFLGNLEKVQSNYSGSQTDGNGSFLRH